MINISLNMIESIGIAVVFLILGSKIKNRVKIFDKYCIPTPVIGGFIFSILSLILLKLNIIKFEFDTTLQKFFMIMFFTSIGFNANIKTLKKGGKKVFIFLCIAIILITLQNIIPIIISKFLNINPLIALMTGSTPMTGGHGTSSAIAESININGAKTVAISSATFGLIMGSIIGPPIANNLINKYSLKPSLIEESEKEVNTVTKKLDENNFSNAFFVILLSMATGTIINIIFSKLNLKFPEYIGPMFIAAIIRNLSDFYYKDLPMDEIKIVEDISLNLFLSMSLITLKLWELIDLAGPLTILLLSQIILTYTFVRFITFNVMGGDYDAAVISAGHAGFGLGATPNALANMKTITDKYYYSKVAFLVVPIVGALFIDFFNVSIISIFISYFS